MKFGNSNISGIAKLYFNVKNNFYEVFITCWAQIAPKIKTALNLLKFDTFDITNIAISILMSEMIFMKYLPPVRFKLVQTLKVPRICGNLAHLIFQVCGSLF